MTPDKLPRSDAEDRALYGEGYSGGGGWQMAGQMLFNPDANAPSDFSAGVANMRAFDGARAIRGIIPGVEATGGGQTEALCLRMRAEWTPDWWNRNGISTPTSTAIPGLRQRYPDLPLPAVATARGQIQTSVTGFLAFRNGVIAAAGTGNDSYTGIGNEVLPVLQLPPGKVPTGLALSGMNEFLFVTVWDTNAVKGQLAVIAVGPQDPANIGPADTGRFGWGVQSWPTIRGLKLLGFVDLPMAAPTSVSVALSSGTKSFRGYNTWRGPELTTDAGRAEWNARSVLDYDAFLPQETHWKNLAAAGYVAVGSRAENKVAIVDLRPLLTFYRTMYLTTQANWNQTANSNQGPGDNQWPYTFAARPEQMPKVLGTIEVQQPTAVFARQKRLGANARSGRVVQERWNELGKRLTIATMDGKIRQYDVTSLVNPTRTPQMPTATIAEWQTGANPVQVTAPIAGDFLSDDIFVVSRGTRRIYVNDWRGQPLATLQDSRLVDPVNIAIGPNYAGYAGSGANNALNVRALAVLDYNGKIVHSYGMNIGNSAGWPAEQWPFRPPSGTQAQTFQYGFGNRLAGKPFMFSFDEVI
ncbi:hypothetical protein [Erythrobacter colymbi]|uniref:hypothetical protein n=1 Tax=Erythrobacter colymbi TaxID=1161202 RepID=UPI000A361C5A|nr:hypothetical protein [Erythrobacter colymbi]